MQLKKEIKFETLRKSHKKQIIIGSVLVCVVGSILTFSLSKAKYRLTQSMKLVTGTINYKVPDLRVVALYTENNNNEYVESDNIPTSGYTLNEEKSLCRVYDGTTSVAEAPKDELITIEYKDGRIYINDLTKKNTRCYLYFDLIEDSEKPVIANVETSSTENSITINVTATDNIGVNKYYYQIDSEEVIEKTESSHTFTGLILGSSHTIKVYVKDGRGNTSEETTKAVSTVGTSETTLAKLGITNNMIHTDEPDFSQIATEVEFTLSYSKIKNLANITNDTTYPFDYDESTGVFTSTNKVNNTTSTLIFSPNEEVNAAKICYIISSEEKYDKAIIYLDGSKKEEVSGEKSGCIELGNINSSNVIKVEYTKDSSQSKGKDQVEVYLENSVFEEYFPIENNGIYKASDPMYNGETYYWRGAATTNHVIFANKCWRIVRINGDGTIRLIYNGTPSGTAPNQACQANPGAGSIAVTKQKYNLDYNNSAYVGYTYTTGLQRPENATGTIEESNLKTQTDTWYNNNIGNNETYASHVADGKYCNDRNTKNNETWRATGSDQYYAAYARLAEVKTPTLSCDTQDVYTLKAGAITADEVVMAGGRYLTNNFSYYLYNGQDYWTMSPHQWYSGGAVYAFYVDGNARLNSFNVGIASNATEDLGIRPVINIRSDVTFNSGSDGTQNNPYIVQ